MKTFRIINIILTVLFISLATSSCSKEEFSNNDKKDNEIIGFYEINNKETGIISIEFTINNECILELDESFDDSIFENANQTKDESRGTRTAKVIYFFYKKVSPTIYALEGYGKLVVKKSGKYFTLSPITGKEIELDVSQKKPISNTKLTKKLCKTWIAQKVYAKQFLDGNFYGECIYDCQKGRYEKSYNVLGGELYIAYVHQTDKVAFFESGTYISYLKGTLLIKEVISSWSWQDEEKGWILWNRKEKKDIKQGVITASFEGNNLVLVESQEFKDKDKIWQNFYKTVYAPGNINGDVYEKENENVDVNFEDKIDITGTWIMVQGEMDSWEITITDNGFIEEIWEDEGCKEKNKGIYEFDEINKILYVVLIDEKGNIIDDSTTKWFVLEYDKNKMTLRNAYSDDVYQFIKK